MEELEARLSEHGTEWRASSLRQKEGCPLKQPCVLCGPPEAQLLNPDASVRDAATASLRQQCQLHPMAAESSHVCDGRKIRGIKAVPVIVHAWQAA